MGDVSESLEGDLQLVREICQGNGEKNKLEAAVLRVRKQGDGDAKKKLGRMLVTLMCSFHIDGELCRVVLRSIRGDDGLAKHVVDFLLMVDFDKVQIKMPECVLRVVNECVAGVTAKEGDEMFRKLYQLQVKMLEKAYHDDCGKKKRKRYNKQMMKVSDALLDKYVECLRKSISSNEDLEAPGNIAMLGMVAEGLKTGSDGNAKELVEKVLSLSLKSRGPSNPEVIFSINPLLSMITQDQFVSILKPIIENTLNLRAEAKLADLAITFKHLAQVDLSAFMDDLFFMPAVNKALTNADESVRANAVALVKAFGARSKSAGIAISILNSLGETLQGTGTLGKQVVAQPYQRMALVRSIQAFVVSVKDGKVIQDGNDATSVAQVAVDLLTAFAKKENNAPVCALALNATIDWIEQLIALQPSQEAELDPNTVTSLVDGLCSNDTLIVREYIRGLTRICTLASTGPIRKQIAKALLQKGSVKVKSVVEGGSSSDGGSSALGSNKSGSSANTKSSSKTSSGGASGGTSKGGGKKKKNDLDALEEQMLALGGGGGKKKSTKSSSSKSSAATSLAGSSSSSTGSSSTGLIGMLVDTVVNGDSLSSILFKEHYQVVVEALSILVVLANEDPAFEKEMESKSSTDLFAQYVFKKSMKKPNNALLVKSSRLANTNFHSYRRESVVIAGVHDTADDDFVPMDLTKLQELEEFQLLLAGSCRYIVNQQALLSRVPTNENSIICLVMVALGLSPFRSVRDHMIGTVKLFVESEKGADQAIVDAIQLYLGSSKNLVVIGSSLTNLVRSLISKESPLTLLPQLLVFSHHPFSKKDSLWSIIENTYGEKHLLSKIDLMNPVITDLCYDVNASDDLVASARGALASLVGFHGVTSDVVKFLKDHVDHGRVNSITKDQCIILGTPDNVLSTVGHAELMAQAQEKEKKEAEKTKQISGGSKGKTADDRWEEQVRAELEAKKLKESGGKPKEAETVQLDEKLVKRKVEEENELRASLKNVTQETMATIELMKAIALDASHKVQDSMREILSIAHPLANAPFTKAKMESLYQNLFLTCPSHAIRNSKMFLACALQIALRRDVRPESLVILSQAAKLLHVKVCDMGDDEEVVRHGIHMTEGTLHLVFPIIREVIFGISKNPELVVFWASQVGGGGGNGENEDDDEDDEDEDQEGGEDGEKKKKKSKKTDDDDKAAKKKKKASSSTKEDKPKKKKKEEKESSGGKKKKEKKEPVVTIDLGALADCMESPVVSMERSLDLVKLHVQVLAKTKMERAEIVEALLFACSVIPEANPRPSTVLTMICSTPPPFEEETIFQELMGESGLLSEATEVRSAAINALLGAASIGLDIKLYPLFGSRIWFANSDENVETRNASLELIDQVQLALPKDFMGDYVKLLGHPFKHVRVQAGRAIAAGIRTYPGESGKAIDLLVKKYQDELSLAKAEEIERANSKPKFIDRDAERKEKEWIIEKRRPRHGVAYAILCCAGGGEEEGGEDKKTAPTGVFESNDKVAKAFAFVCEHGLCDIDAVVRQTFLEAGTQIVVSYGKEMIDTLLPMLEPFIKSSSKSSSGVESDWQREGSVILMGRLAPYMDRDDERIPRVVDNLIEALRTPSEPVQLAATNCLPPLMKTDLVKAKGGDILNQLMTRATLMQMDGDEEFVSCPTSMETSYGERRGAAFGVGSVVKGLGITLLKKNKVVPWLEAASKSQHAESREGSLFVLESLSSILGMLFEPYVIQILPSLLQAFSDTKKSVRTAAQDASRAIMARLSGHGVKLVMPSLLKAINDPAWRTKQAAIRMLGSMAFCARKQLAACLPQIVPVLATSLTDSHQKVRVSSGKALKDIGSVIQNPEIKALVPTIKRAFTNPDTKTSVCVDALHRTRFVHMVDAPSLALIVPVLDRGLTERSTDTKKKAALIVGNMCSMISDPKAVLPYVKDLMPVLRKVLIDPIPGVRSTAAKALGTLTSGLGEGLPDFGDLMQWLLETSRGNTSPVERSGGAQGLVEVMVALGEDYTHKILNENIFPMASNSSPAVREGVIWVLVFLPPCLGPRKNAPLIERELPLVIKGLSDESEFVRDVSLRSGQVLVELHAIEHTNQLLPVLEEGLEDPKWRIRQSSVHLLGDLLYRVGGNADAVYAARAAQATRNITAAEDEDDADEEDDEEEDDENDRRMESGVPGVPTKRRAAPVADEAFSDALAKALGKEKREDILASLYVLRNDLSAVVRQSAVNVWKNVVPNTGRTLREILKPLMKKIVDALSNPDNEDAQVVAGRCLGDIVKKLGDRVLPDIMPIIEEGLRSPNDVERAGISLGLVEIILHSSRRQLENFQSQFLPIVQDALCDSNPDVQSSGAEAFGGLYRQLGPVTVSEIVPSLLKRLQSSGTGNEDGKRALQGLTKILSLRSREIMPLLLPTLLVSPMTPFHAESLQAVCSTIGGVLHFYVEKIQDFLVKELSQGKGGPGGENEQAYAHVWSCAVSLMGNIEDEGVDYAVSGLISPLVESKDGEEKRVAVALLGDFCENTSTDFSSRTQQMIKEMIKRFGDSEYPELMKQGHIALTKLIKAVGVEDMCKNLDFMRSMLKSVASDAKYRLKDPAEMNKFTLPGLNMAKGLDPFIPIYQHALMNGSAEDRESAALGLGELVDLTTEASLKPYVIKITGPLIRIVGDRFPWQVKVAILQTLTKLIGKGGPMLRPFLPQLQTTFVKSINSENSRVRAKGVTALKRLLKIGTRVDPLVTDLSSTANSDITDNGIRLSVLVALCGVLQVSGDKVGQPVLEKVIENCGSQFLLTHQKSEIRERTIFALSKSIHLLKDEAVKMDKFNSKVLDRIKTQKQPTMGEWVETHVNVLLSKRTLRDGPDMVFADDSLSMLITDTIIDNCAKSKTMGLVQLYTASCMGAIALAFACPDSKSKLAEECMTHVSGLLTDSSTPMENVVDLLKSLRNAARRNPAGSRLVAPKIVPVIYNIAKDSKVKAVVKDQANVVIEAIFLDPETMKHFVKNCSSQTVVRAIPDYHKKLLLAKEGDNGSGKSNDENNDDDDDDDDFL